jgi:phosphoglycolate phosphatase
VQDRRGAAPKLRLLNIDLDGTLVDSAPDLAHCVDRTLESLGRPLAGEPLVRTWIGDGIESLLQRALESGATGAIDDATLRTALTRFSACYRANLYVRSCLYPGVADTLRTLSAAGIALACVTNKRAEFAEGLLRAAGIRPSFVRVIGGDSLPEKKPSALPLVAVARDLGIAPAESAMVGDSYHDYHAAVAAGCAFYWASYGYRSHVDAAGPTPFCRLEHFADLAPLAQQLAGGAE